MSQADCSAQPTDPIRAVLQAAAEAFASGEIDRTELMRRIARVK
jgi:hypothetical protein